MRAEFSAQRGVWRGGLLGLLPASTRPTILDNRRLLGKEEGLTGGLPRVSGADHPSAWGVAGTPVHFSNPFSFLPPGI